MSQTATTSTPRTVTLHNGTTFTFNSNISTDAEKIPLIDAKRIWSDNLDDRKAVALEVRKAAHEIGFFYLINHGVDSRYGEKVLEQSKRFFALSEEKKMEVFTGLVPDEYVGFHPMECYNRNGWKHQDLMEAFNWNYDVMLDPEAEDKSAPCKSLWPSNLPGFKETLYEYHTELLQLARRLTRIFALALELPEDYFDEYVKHPEAGMRITHYPQQTNSVDEQNGIGAHTDVECFTMVTQDSAGGLEVLSKSGNWIKAEPMPGSFVVNIADAFMRQTNDYFVSTIHRVINYSGRERYSAPFFFGFDRNKLLHPVPTTVSEENPAKYPLMTAGEYYAWRTKKQKSTMATKA